MVFGYFMYQNTCVTITTHSLPKVDVYGKSYSK